MRIGIMIGPETRNYAGKVDRLCEDARDADEAGFATAWIPQLPQDFDAMTAVALMGRDDPDRVGHRGRPAAVAPPDRARADRRCRCRPVCGGRFSLGVGPSHHWVIDTMLGLPYERPAQLVEDYLDVFDAMFAGPGGRRRERPLPDPQSARHHRHRADAGAPRRARPGDAPDRGERADGTVLWMADERAIAEHVVPRITKAADGAGRPAPRVVAGIPVSLCAPDEVDAARERANRILGHAEYSPNYQRLLERGDATDVGDIAAPRHRGRHRAPAAVLRRRGHDRPLGTGHYPPARGATSCWRRVAGRATSWRRWPGIT